MLQLVLGQSPVCLTAFFDYTLTYTLFYPFLGLKDTFLQGILQIEELGELLNIADLNHKGLSDRLQATYRFELSSQEIIAFEDLEYGWYQITESSNIGMGSLFSLTYQGIKLIRHTEEASSIESTLTVQGEGGGKRKITITNKLDRNVRCTLNKI